MLCPSSFNRMALVAFQFHGLSPDMSPSRIGDVAVIRCQRTFVGKVPSAGHGGVRVAGHPYDGLPAAHCVEELLFEQVQPSRTQILPGGKGSFDTSMHLLIMCRWCRWSRWSLRSNILTPWLTNMFHCQQHTTTMPGIVGEDTQPEFWRPLFFYSHKL